MCKYVSFVFHQKSAKQEVQKTKILEEDKDSDYEGKEDSDDSDYAGWNT